MRRVLFFLFILGMTVGCTSQPPVKEQKLYVSILPLRSLVSHIVGDDFPIEVLVPAGASPETFEPTPRQFIELNRAQLVFSVGLIDFESALLSKLEDQQRIVNLSKGIELIAGSCSHCNHNHEHSHQHHGIDPHVWTAPKALQQMARNAYEAIHRIYPDSAKYTANHDALQNRLQQLDQTVSQQITQSNIRYFIIYHPALSYYARDYGIDQVAIEQDGKEPSAKRLAELIDRARNDGVKRIFYQSQFPASSVEIIAKDIAAEAVQLDPLREDVIANIQEITTLILGR